MRHLIIPDVQLMPGDSVEFLGWIGQYVVDQKPDKLICLGDFADMASLSSYDRGTKSYEGRRYVADIEIARKGMSALMNPITCEITRRIANKKKAWKPQMEMFYGNHEERIVRATESSAELDGVLSLEDLGYEEAGWNCNPFLEVKVIDGIAYSHYFTSGVKGQPVSSAQRLIQTKHMSCIAGHMQGRDVAYAHKADGTRITAIIAGSCYEHDHDYMGPQGNKHWRGLIVLNEVKDGEFDELFVSLDYLRKRYGS